MIEITAKQLYDIYRRLPNARMYVMNNPKGNKKKVANVSFLPYFDEKDNAFIWKPTTDLIIKA